MQTQLYLCPDTQSHFDIAPQTIPADSDTLLSSDWKSLWRCQHLVSTEDEKEHLFMLTNAVSNYSMILVDRTRDVVDFLRSFQQSMLLQFCEHGMNCPDKESFLAEVQLIAGHPSELIDQMESTADLALEKLYSNEVDIQRTEREINSTASHRIRKRLTERVSVRPATAILSFPG